MEKQLKLGLDIIASLEKTEGKYIDMTTNGINTCGAISIMATSFKDDKPLESSILFSPMPKYVFSSPIPFGKTEIVYDIKPFIGIGEIKNEDKVIKYPVVNINFLSYKNYASSIEEILLEFNKTKKMPFRFIGVFIIYEDEKTGKLDLKTVEFSTKEYELQNLKPS